MPICRLRKIAPQQDMDKIYQIYSDYKEQSYLFDIRSLNSPDRFPELFERRLSNNYKDFSIIDDADGAFAGFLIAYDYAENDGHVKILEYICPEYRKSGIGAIAALQYIETLFRTFRIRKVYTEVFGYNDDSIAMHSSFGFEKEATLKNYRFYDGRYWDYHIFSMDREHFYERYRHHLQRLAAL